MAHEPPPVRDWLILVGRHAASMAEFKSLFDAGDKRALPHALCECVCSYPEKPVPEWARQELAKAMYAVTMAQAASWDDVFGKPHEGHKVPALRTQRALQYKIKKRVLELRRQRPKPEDILRVVAGENGISRATCKRIFESSGKRLT